jgi:hypothetical protein
MTGDGFVMLNVATPMVAGDSGALLRHPVFPTLDLVITHQLFL